MGQGQGLGDQQKPTGTGLYCWELPGGLRGRERKDSSSTAPHKQQVNYLVWTAVVRGLESIEEQGIPSQGHTLLLWPLGQISGEFTQDPY